MSERERDRDRKRLDKLIDAWERELELEPSAEVLALASKSVVSLLERRSKLLGLDVASGSEARQDGIEKPLDRIMRVVPGKGGA